MLVLTTTAVKVLGRSVKSCVKTLSLLRKNLIERQSIAVQELTLTNAGCLKERV